MEVLSRVARPALVLTFFTGCTSLSAMQTVDLENTSDFPKYEVTNVLDMLRY